MANISIPKSTVKVNPQKTLYQHFQEKAHEIVGQALKKGTLVRPQYCQRCGHYSANIQAHHDDYSKPLEVIWLCIPCHRKDPTHQPRNIFNRQPAERIGQVTTFDQWADSLVRELKSYDLNTITKVNDISLQGNIPIWAGEDYSTAKKLGGTNNGEVIKATV